MYVVKKDETALVFDQNKKRIRFEVQLLVDRVLNEALAQMADEFVSALARGELLVLDGNEDELRGLLRRAAAKELGTDALS